MTNEVLTHTHEVELPEHKIIVDENDAEIHFRAVAKDAPNEQLGDGFILLRPSHEQDLLTSAEYQNTATIYQLWVEESYRRHGIAAELMNAMETWAQENGHDKLILCVVPSNENAKRLYEKRGYELTPVDGRETISSVWWDKGETVTVDVQLMVKRFEKTI